VYIYIKLSNLTNHLMFLVQLYFHRLRKLCTDYDKRYQSDFYVGNENTVCLKIVFESPRQKSCKLPKLAVKMKSVLNFFVQGKINLCL
jgi:hypothetical protein